MAESVLDLIFRIRKQGSGGAETERELKKAQKAAEAYKKELNNTVKELTGFDAASLTAAAGIAAVGAAAVGAIKYTLEWAGSIDKLSRNTGLATEEASKLAIVAGDVGIEIGTLEKSLKAMNKDGLELNFATLKKVSAQYNATADPVKRLRIATDAFGTAAQDMSEILSRSPEELDALAAAAERSGKVMSEDAVAAAELFEQNLKQLQDTAQGLAVTFGNAAIPVLNKAGASFQGLTKIVALNTVEMQLQYGAITETEAQLRRLEIATGGTGEAWEDYNASLIEVNERTADNSLAQAEAERQAQLLEVQTMALNSAWLNYGPTVSDAVLKNEELRKTLEPLTGAASDLAFGMGELTTATLFNAAAAGLNAEDAYKLAEQMGLIDKAAAGAKTVLDELREEFEKTDDIQGYTRDVGLLDAAVRSLPSGQSITIEIFEQYRKQYMDEFNAENSGQGGTESGQYGGAQGDGYAAGTGGQWVTVPPGYPNDSYPVRLSSGEQFAVVPANQSTTNMGGVTINVSGSGNPNAVGAEVERRLRALGASADRRQRT